MPTVTVTTRKGVARRYRVGVAFGATPVTLDVDDASRRELEADPYLVVTLVRAPAAQPPEPTPATAPAPEPTPAPETESPVESGTEGIEAPAPTPSPRRGKGK